ncbi:SusC/RagA family TonB-linked outer membrane protein [Cyclobacterium amurskyense]|uniref:TonB-dependent receptor plug n=1 Tax=Cyclobacterium amurskyense TaxID=320787 RepID=A0A0H4PCK1_9BACT|nr:TonB-dependent receptor [Cyclobacterium amurskyense]AKP52181.1 TonB-dependent receptor plug [Cyclobacterium amurskyense]
MRKAILLVITLLSVNFLVQSQTRTVRGKVTTFEDGLPIPGATVMVKGSTSGTVSDIEGNYQIQIKEDEKVLLFRFVGLQPQEVVIGNRSNIDVALNSDITSLDEVVVTSYGDQTRREVTGAIASVKGEIFQDLPMQSFDRAIQGRIAGVQVTSDSGQPGGTLTVQVRGVGSINAGTEPLYIVDGVQIASGGLSGEGSQNALSSINPSDIESIEVFKDAAAAAIYGAQAANGVVLITTKKGKSGKTRVRFSAQEGIVQPIGFYDVMNASELASIKRQAYINAGLNFRTVESIFGSPSDADLQNSDWIDALYRDGRMSVYDISLSGGDERTQFFLSGSHTYHQGQIIQSDYSRSTGRMNLSHKVNERFTIGANFSLAKQVTNGSIDRGNYVNSPFVAGYAARPNVPIYNEDGTYAEYPSEHLFGYNIVQGVNEELKRATSYQSVSNLNMNYKILPWLGFTGFAGLDFSDNRDENNRPSTIPVFASYGGSSYFADRRIVNSNANANFNVNKKIFDVHTISGILGYEYKKETQETNSAIGRGFPNPVLRYLQNAAVPFDVGGFYTEYIRSGFFGQAKYDYDDKYNFDLTIRRDGSSRFGSNSRWGTFGAVSAGWRISSEPFMRNTDWVDNLRLRTSYGVTGNSSIGNFESRTLLSTAGQYLGGGALSFVQLGNDLLTWEESVSTNIGVDATLFNGRIIVTLDAWRKDSRKLLFDTRLPLDSGFGSITRNAGKLRNQGIDFDIQTTNLLIGKFSWSTRFNTSIFSNELLELYEGLDRVGNDLIVGKPIGFLYGYEYAGVNPANGSPMYYDENGEYTYQVTDDDMKYLGSTMPWTYGGLSNTLKYGPVSLEVFFQYQYGNLAFNQDLYNLAQAGSIGQDNQTKDQLYFWREPGQITNVPIPYEGGRIPGHSGYQQTSTRLISDGSYIRLKQVTLNYNLPKTLLNKVKIEELNVFVQGINLWTLTKYNGLDPEVNSLGTTYGTYPSSKQMTAGINLTF